MHPGCSTHLCFIRIANIGLDLTEYRFMSKICTNVERSHLPMGNLTTATSQNLEPQRLYCTTSTPLSGVTTSILVIYMTDAIQYYIYISSVDLYPIA